MQYAESEHVESAVLSRLTPVKRQCRVSYRVIDAQNDHFAQLAEEAFRKEFFHAPMNAQAERTGYDLRNQFGMLLAGREHLASFRRVTGHTGFG